MSELQDLLDAIPAQRRHRLIIESIADSVLLGGRLGPEDARATDADQAHGGVVAALLDTAATLALVATDGRPWVTVDLRIDYLRPLPLGDVVVLGSALRVGRTVGRSTAEIRDGEGRTCATAVGTFVA